MDAASWSRGRGWALWKTLATCLYACDDPEDAEEFASAKRLLDEILSEHAASRSAEPTVTVPPPA